MGSKRSDARRLAKLIKPYGLTIVPARKHKQIIKDGKVVWHMSSTPSDGYYAINTLSDLKRRGLVPREVKL
jgi:hypothetical protein